MWPLYGGGFWVAFAQACMVYYIAATILHLVVPRVVPVASVQSGKTKPGQELREARSSIGKDRSFDFFSFNISEREEKNWCRSLFFVLSFSQRSHFLPFFITLQAH